MSPTEVVSYLGAATALAGLILGIANWRRLSAYKRLDLRLQLRLAIVDLEEGLSSLPGLIERANTSRIANASAAGRLRSGFMEAWAAEVADSQALVQSLKNGIPVSLEDLDRMAPQQLEERLAETRRISLKVAGLRDKYRSTMEQDQLDVRERREQINRSR